MTLAPPPLRSGQLRLIPGGPSPGGYQLYMVEAGGVEPPVRRFASHRGAHAPLMAQPFGLLSPPCYDSGGTFPPEMNSPPDGVSLPPGGYHLPMVEAGGVEPPSRRASALASTSVFRGLKSHGGPARGQPRRRQSRKVSPLPRRDPEARAILLTSPYPAPQALTGGRDRCLSSQSQFSVGVWFFPTV